MRPPIADRLYRVRAPAAGAFRQPPAAALLRGVAAASGGIAEHVRAVDIIPGATEFGYDTAIRDAQARRGRRPRRRTRHARRARSRLDGLARRSAGDCARSSRRRRWWSPGSATICAAANARSGPASSHAQESTHPHDLGVAGLDRDDAHLVSAGDEGSPPIGGTPSDASVIRAIARSEGARPEGDVLSLHPDGRAGRAIRCPIQ